MTVLAARAAADGATAAAVTLDGGLWGAPGVLEADEHARGVGDVARQEVRVGGAPAHTIGLTTPTVHCLVPSSGRCSKPLAQLFWCRARLLAILRARLQLPCRRLRDVVRSSARGAPAGFAIASVELGHSICATLRCSVSSVPGSLWPLWARGLEWQELRLLVPDGVVADDVPGVGVVAEYPQVRRLAKLPPRIDRVAVLQALYRHGLHGIPSTLEAMLGAVHGAEAARPDELHFREGGREVAVGQQLSQGGSWRHFGRSGNRRLWILRGRRALCREARRQTFCRQAVARGRAGCCKWRRGVAVQHLGQLRLRHRSRRRRMALQQTLRGGLRAAEHHHCAGHTEGEKRNSGQHIPLEHIALSQGPQGQTGHADV
mmetsp:Transcript_38845/g.109888  ORF Transcript_38845/g.109888 Transcript_38845/m.109888 type:complete len:374 (+) Transcript_38845:898-2019(+)